MLLEGVGEADLAPRVSPQVSHRIVNVQLPLFCTLFTQVCTYQFDQYSIKTGVTASILLLLMSYCGMLIVQLFFQYFQLNSYFKQSLSGVGLFFGKCKLLHLFERGKECSAGLIPRTSEMSLVYHTRAIILHVLNQVQDHTTSFATASLHYLCTLPSVGISWCAIYNVLVGSNEQSK